MNKDENKSSLGKKVARYGKVSTKMAGLAARLAGERYLGVKIEREKHAIQLMESLGNLKGPLMKIGQILATIPDALPPEYATAFQQLQASAPPMNWPFVRRRMKTELGSDWESQFKDFGREAAAAASLGQVHKAITLDEQVVACKLQYPDMRSAIEADLSQLKLIFSLFERYDKAIETQYIHDELSARLYEELDYELEAKYCRLYAFMLQKERSINVPQVLDNLSTSRLLTATWLEGEKILSFVDSDLEHRNKLAMNMFRAWYVPLYYYGIIHGDPHLGNYTITKKDQINLLDFGCVRIFPADFVGGVIDLYHALQKGDRDLSVHAYETWGFEDLSNEQIDTLNIWANFLYGPILEDKTRPIGETKNGFYGKETARKVHKKLRDIGGVKIPREFVFMDRAALGLGSVFLHLKAEINWYKLFNEMIENFSIEKMNKAQSDVLKKFDITPTL